MKVAKLMSQTLLMSLAQGSALYAGGAFSGPVKTEWIIGGSSDRRMKLLEDFSYTDEKGKVWLAPKNTIIDGASIPRIFWSIVGNPYDGGYREASVVHDYYCEVRSENSNSVHRMFYHACLDGGVEKAKAKILFYAVYWFGPSWKEGESFTKPLAIKTVIFESSDWSIPARIGGRTVPADPPDRGERAAGTIKVIEVPIELDETQAKSIEKWIREEDPSLETLEKAFPQEKRTIDTSQTQQAK